MAEAIQRVVAPVQRSEAEPLPRIPLRAPLCTIGPAPKKEEEPHLMLTLLKEVYQPMELRAARDVDFFKAAEQEYQARIDTLDAKKIAELQKEVTLVQSQQTWGALSAVATIVALFLAATQATAIATITLAASAVLEMTRQVVTKTTLSQAIVSRFTQSEETRQKIVNGIDKGLLSAQMACFIIGAIASWQAGVFTQQLADKAKLAPALNSVSTAFSVTTRIGNAANEKKMADTQARLKEIETETSVSRNRLYAEATSISNLLRFSRLQLEEMVKMHQALTVG